ncbi:unnamed protein product, partial [Scytosiphon promiscuus]
CVFERCRCCRRLWVGGILMMRPYCGPCLVARRSCRDKGHSRTARLSLLLFILLTREGRTFVHTPRASTASRSSPLQSRSSSSWSSPSSPMASPCRPGRRPPTSQRELRTNFSRDAGNALPHCNNGGGDGGRSGSWASPPTD